MGSSSHRPLQLMLQLAIGLLLLLPNTTSALGGELAKYTTTPLETNVSHRQDVCHRYQLFREGKLQLRDALSGLSLHPLLLARKFFVYDNETGVPGKDPGLMADLMDAVAESANFTWRQSFGIMELPQVFNKTWTEMLLWGVETYDIAVYSWDQSVERMEHGVAYVKPFFDGSLILIDQKDAPEDTRDINLLNWTLPFESEVWAMTIFTIILSACVYQLIEHRNGEREGRTWTQWFSDNLFLSSLNFTQNFEYAPNSVAGRIFSVSMALWALVMTATYTANLASLFVEEQRYPLVVDSIEQAILSGYPICTYGNTNADGIIKERHPDAIRIPKDTELETFQALRKGECKLAVSYKDNWLSFQGNRQYNPHCDLEWVGRDVDIIKSGFAVKADAGYKCSSLVRDVFNLHLVELSRAGKLQDAWEEHRAKTRDISCGLEEIEGDDDDDDDDYRRRLNEPSEKETAKYRVHAATPTFDPRRKLKKGGGASAAKSSSEGGDESSLTLAQMMGTFVLHYAGMALALFISFASPYFVGCWFYPKGERVVYRTHGPIIGQPPPVNTYALAESMKARSKCIANSSTRSSVVAGNFRGSLRESQNRTNVMAGNFRNSLRELSTMVEELRDSQARGENLRGSPSNERHHVDNHHQTPASTGMSDEEEIVFETMSGSSHLFNAKLHMWKPDRARSLTSKDPLDDSSEKETDWKTSHNELRRQQQSLEQKIDGMDAKMDILIMMMQQNMKPTNDAGGQAAEVRPPARKSSTDSISTDDEHRTQLDCSGRCLAR